MRAFAFAEPFRNRNYAVYFAGQVASNTGTWFQNLAISLVVLQLTGSSQALSWVTVAQFTPILLLSVSAGRLADRVRPRTIMLVAAFASAVLVGAMAVVLAVDGIPLWPVFVLLFLLGCAGAFDRVASQTIIFELVGARDLSRGAALTTIAQAAARSVGPGLAGLAFQGLGPVWCMVINAVSFLLVGISLLLIRPKRMFPRTSNPDAVRPTLRQLLTPQVVTILIVNVVISLLAFSLMVTITSTVTLDFGGDASAVGAAHALNALGALVGGAVAASRGATRVSAIIPALLLFAGGYLLIGLTPTLMLFLVVAPLHGLVISYYQSTLFSVAQSIVPPEQIGRMMSLITLGHYGMTPFGAVLVGALIDATSGRAVLVMGAIAALACAVFVTLRRRHFRRQTPPAD